MNIRKLIRKEVRKVMDASELDAARERLERLEEVGAPQSRITKEKNTIKALEKKEIRSKSALKEKEKELENLTEEFESRGGTRELVDAYDKMYKEAKAARNKVLSDPVYANKWMAKFKNKWWDKGMDIDMDDKLDSKSRKILGFDGTPKTKAQSMKKLGVSSDDYDRAMSKFVIAYDKTLKELRISLNVTKKEYKEFLKQEKKLKSEIETLKSSNSRSSIFKI